jgi:hypothetical protein
MVCIASPPWLSPIDRVSPVLEPAAVSSPLRARTNNLRTSRYNLISVRASRFYFRLSLAHAGGGAMAAAEAPRQLRPCK